MEKSVKLTIAISLLFASFGQIASDLYLPSLPYITVDLATRRELVQLTVTCFMVSYCISRLIYGPISDGIGRKIPLVIGFIITFVGSCVCLAATNIYILMAGRIIQGFGAAAGSVLTGAILRDMLEGRLLSKFNSYFAFVNIIFVASAPLAGGYLEEVFGWRSTFLVLLAYTILLLIMTIFLFKETNNKRNPENIKIKQIVTNIKYLLNNRIFVVYTILVMAGYAAVLAWLTSGPIIIQKQLHYSPVQFGWIALVFGGFTYCVGALMNTKLVMIHRNKSLVLFGVSLMVVSGIYFIIASALGMLNIYNIVIPVSIFSFGNSFTFPSSYSGALTPFPELAGSAAAVLSSMQILGGVVGSALIALMPFGSLTKLGLVVFVCGLISVAVLVLTTRRFRLKVFLFFFRKKLERRRVG